MIGTRGMPVGGGRERKRSPKFEVCAMAVALKITSMPQSDGIKTFLFWCIVDLPKIEFIIWSSDEILTVPLTIAIIYNFVVFD
jgi:hypothetical protein